MVSVQTPDIVSGDEFRGFWMRWDGGVISVGREDEVVPFLSWGDPDPFPIAFIGVCTGWGASGRWKLEGIYYYINVYVQSNHFFAYAILIQIPLNPCEF